MSKNNTLVIDGVGSNVDVELDGPEVDDVTRRVCGGSIGSELSATCQGTGPAN